ncbi:hypothetical protein P3T39_005318 [Kitasatospora sp. GP82]|nr:hypothetical protein [Kitasatospora sp. GP82]
MAACRRAQARFSLTMRMNPHLAAAIAAIAEVAETAYAAFTGRTKTEQVTARNAGIVDCMPTR